MRRDKETAACTYCGRVRTINASRHGGTCAACRYLSIAERPGDWVHQAVCTQTDPELFWPENSNPRGIKAAQEICLTCPVISDCLQYAIDTKQNQGIWGGLTPAGRRAWSQMTEAS